MAEEKEPRNLDLARQYLAAIERGADAEEIGRFLHADIVADELPNRLAPNGVRRNRAAMLEGVERGRKLLVAQSYEIAGALASGDRVALEVRWSGTLAAAFGPLAAGTTLRARIGIFLEFRDGQIVAQRNYDCYDPW
jgi:ketosteroid isomerase-like protein